MHDSARADAINDEVDVAASDPGWKIYDLLDDGGQIG